MVTILPYDDPASHSHSEREGLEREQAELQERIAGWNIEPGTTAESVVWRPEFLDQQIRNARRRLIVIANRLEGLGRRDLAQ